MAFFSIHIILSEISYTFLIIVALVVNIEVKLCQSAYYYFFTIPLSIHCVSVCR